MAIIDCIKYDGTQQESEWLVYKYPSEEFVMGSQLIVSNGQEAIFLKGGEVAEVFRPGTHTLKTGNLPLLNKLVKLPFGGVTPFSAEVYYINKTSKLNMSWGTTNPIPIEDPKYGLILSIRAHGQYGITISDSRLFISQIIGALPHGTELNHLFISRYFNGLINSKIKDITAQFMIRNQISFLEVTGYLDELSKIYKEAIVEQFERFGIEIVNFFVDAISPPKEEYEKLRGYKEELALGERFYTQRRSFDVLEKMASNPNGGSMVNMGMEFGIGLNAGNVMGNAMHQVQQQFQPQFGVQPQAQPQSQSGQSCPHCHASVQSGMKFCGACGKPVVSLRCPRCNMEVAPGMKFCGNCGERVGG